MSGDQLAPSETQAGERQGLTWLHEQLPFAGALEALRSRSPYTGDPGTQQPGRLPSGEQSEAGRLPGEAEVTPQAPVVSLLPEGRSLAPGQPALDRPLTLGQPALDRPLTLGQPALDRPLTLGQPALDRPLTLGQPALDRLLTLGQPALDRPLTSGQPALDRLLTLGQPALDRPLTSGQPALDRPLTSGQPALDRPLTSGQPAMGRPLEVEQPPGDARPQRRDQTAARIDVPAQPGSGALASDLMLAQVTGGRDSPFRTGERWQRYETNGVGQDRRVDRGARLDLRYPDTDAARQEFARQLSQTNAEVVRITGLPPNVGLSSWFDQNGFFIWFADGQQQRQRYHLPSSVKTIEINGIRQNVDEMRIAAAEAQMAEALGQQHGFYSYSGRTNPLEYARRMSGLAAETLAFQERIWREGAENSPTNPYFRIYLSDVLLAKAIRPVMAQVMNGQNANFNNPETIRAIDQAIEQTRIAQQIAIQVGNHRVPNQELQPRMNPFALNPYFFNPDLYWGGALYQSWIREARLVALKAIIQSGVVDSLELPPLQQPSSPSHWPPPGTRR